MARDAKVSVDQSLPADSEWRALDWYWDAQTFRGVADEFRSFGALGMAGEYDDIADIIDALLE